MFFSILFKIISGHCGHLLVSSCPLLHFFWNRLTNYSRDPISNRIYHILQILGCFSRAMKDQGSVIKFHNGSSGVNIETIDSIILHSFEVNDRHLIFKYWKIVLPFQKKALVQASLNLFIFELGHAVYPCYFQPRPKVPCSFKLFWIKHWSGSSESDKKNIWHQASKTVILKSSKFSELKLARW